MQDHTKQINSVIIDQLCLGEGYKLDPNANLHDDLGADALDEEELQIAIEEEFGIAIPDEVWNRVHTVKDIYDYINNRLGGGIR